MQNIRIGPAGWSYPDWAGYVYPTRKPKGFHEAAYLADYFDTIEINTSFYQPIRADHARLWIERVAHNPRFLFTAKLWQKFTHDTFFETPGSKTPDSKTPGSVRSGSVTFGSLTSGATAEDERAVRAGFDVLREAGRLGAVLLQFPFSFHRTVETMAYLTAILKRFSDYPLVVEVRHASWKTPEFFDTLRELKAGICNIDQPLIGRSLEPLQEATSPVGYVRLHGRRYDTWFSDDPGTPAHERYNYLYSGEELAPWAGRIRKVAERAKEARQGEGGQVFVVTNNHYQGKAVVNALQLISLLKGEKVKVPEPLRQRYPQLEAIASEAPAEPMLFPLGNRSEKREPSPR